MGNFARVSHLSRWQAEVNPTLAVQVDDVVASATSGPFAGKVGPFDLSATDGRQTLANIVGVSAHRSAAMDATGIQERVQPNQEAGRISIYTHCPACDGNFGFIRDATGTRITLNAEAGQTTKNYLADKQFNFVQTTGLE